MSAEKIWLKRDLDSKEDLLSLTNLKNSTLIKFTIPLQKLNLRRSQFSKLLNQAAEKAQCLVDQEIAATILNS